MTIITVEGTDEELLLFLVKVEELGLTAKQNGEIITAAKLMERVAAQKQISN